MSRVDRLKGKAKWKECIGSTALNLVYGHAQEETKVEKAQLVFFGVHGYKSKGSIHLYGDN